VYSKIINNTLGITVASANRIGNLLGSHQPDQARISAWTAITLTILLSSLCGALIVSFRYAWANLYSKDPEVINIAVQLLPITAFFQFCIATSMICGAILRGQGRQMYAAMIRLLGVYAIGFPIGWLVAFRLDMRLPGLWLTFALAMFAIMLLELMVIIKSHWIKIAQQSRERVHREEQRISH
jgi:MATE family multidrug resistance protein